MKQRIGILGGSFDPIHLGHLILAEQIKTEAELDSVVFVPCYVSPFKIWNKPALGAHRLEMVKLAIGDHNGFDVSDIELQKSEPSYTYNTLKELKKLYGDEAELYFIIGTDAFLSIEQWSMSKELLSEFSFLIGLRKGYDEKGLTDVLDDLRKRYPLKAEYIRIPELEISASDLREKLGAGKSVKFLLPDAVISYIKQEGLYQSLVRAVREFAKKNEKPSRYKHTEGVVSMAKELALMYGADPEKAEIAAWFHDAYRSLGNLEHGPAAAEALKSDFGVTDKDILNAVRYHTTGRPGMSLLEKIIYIADSLEPGREYPDSAMLRKTIDQGVDKCLYRLMVHTKKYVESLGVAFDPLSTATIRELEQSLQKEKRHE